MSRVAVIGGGAFGTAMAAVAARAGATVSIWALEAEVVEAINQMHENSTYLKGVRLDASIRAHQRIDGACDGAEIVLLVPPAQHLRAVCGELNMAVRESVPIVICSKGIEQRTGSLMSEVAAAVMPGRVIAVLSGPTFADELARGVPSAVTLAVPNEETSTFLIEALRSRPFRLYTTQDIIGTQIGGAVKNVIAIAAGVATGLGLGENSQAALITRGLAEMTRFGLAKGARPETLLGLSGIGDLLLTCVSAKSRNTSLGLELAKGRKLEDIMNERRSVSEGVFTANALVSLSNQLGVDMPITQAVHAVLTNKSSPRDAVEELLARPPRPEWVS